MTKKDSHYVSPSIIVSNIFFVFLQIALLQEAKSAPASGLLYFQISNIKGKSSLSQDGFFMQNPSKLQAPFLIDTPKGSLAKVEWKNCHLRLAPGTSLQIQSSGHVVYTLTFLEGAGSLVCVSQESGENNSTQIVQSQQVTLLIKTLDGQLVQLDSENSSAFIDANLGVKILQGRSKFLASKTEFQDNTPRRFSPDRALFISKSTLFLDQIKESVPAAKKGENCEEWKKLGQFDNWVKIAASSTFPALERNPELSCLLVQAKAFGNLMIEPESSQLWDLILQKPNSYSTLEYAKLMLLQERYKEVRGLLKSFKSDSENAAEAETTQALCLWALSEEKQGNLEDAQALFQKIVEQKEDYANCKLLAQSRISRLRKNIENIFVSSLAGGWDSNPQEAALGRPFYSAGFSKALLSGKHYLWGHASSESSFGALWSASAQRYQRIENKNLNLSSGAAGAFQKHPIGGEILSASQNFSFTKSAAESETLLFESKNKWKLISADILLSRILNERSEKRVKLNLKGDLAFQKSEQTVYNLSPFVSQKWQFSKYYLSPEASPFDSEELSSQSFGLDALMTHSPTLELEVTTGGSLSWDQNLLRPKNRIARLDLNFGLDYWLSRDLSLGAHAQGSMAKSYATQDRLLHWTSDIQLVWLP